MISYLLELNVGKTKKAISGRKTAPKDPKSPKSLLCLPVTASRVGVSKRSPQKVGRKPKLEAGSPFS